MLRAAGYIDGETGLSFVYAVLGNYDDQFNRVSSRRTARSTPQRVDGELGVRGRSRTPCCV